MTAAPSVDEEKHRAAIECLVWPTSLPLKPTKLMSGDEYSTVNTPYAQRMVETRLAESLVVPTVVILAFPRSLHRRTLADWLDQGERTGGRRSK